MYFAFDDVKATSNRPQDLSRPFQITSNDFKNFGSFSDVSVSYGKMFTITLESHRCVTRGVS